MPSTRQCWVANGSTCGASDIFLACKTGALCRAVGELVLQQASVFLSRVTSLNIRSALTPADLSATSTTLSRVRSQSESPSRSEKGTPPRTTAGFSDVPHYTRHAVPAHSQFSQRNPACLALLALGRPLGRETRVSDAPPPRGRRRPKPGRRLSLRDVAPPRSTSPSESRPAPPTIVRADQAVFDKRTPSGLLVSIFQGRQQDITSGMAVKGFGQSMRPLVTALAPTPNRTDVLCSVKVSRAPRLGRTDATLTPLARARWWQLSSKLEPRTRTSRDREDIHERSPFHRH
jgi:hypothetical protein